MKPTITITIAAPPDADRIRRALVDCYRAGMERKTGKRYKAITEAEDSDGGEQAEAVPRLRA